MKLIALVAFILALSGAYSQELKNVFEFKRALDTCDRDGDVKINKDKISTVVFAMGNSDPEGKTFKSADFNKPDVIGSKDINFFAKSKKGALVPPAAVKSKAKEEKLLKDAKSLVIMASDISVPENASTYYFCAVRSFEMKDLKENLQIIRSQAFIGGKKVEMQEEETGTSPNAVVTNFALYACPPDFDVADEEEENTTMSSDSQQKFNLSEPIVSGFNFSMSEDGIQGDCIGMPRRYLKCVRSPVALWSIRGGEADLPENVGIPLNTSGTFVLKIRIDNPSGSEQLLANTLSEEKEAEPVKSEEEETEKNETSKATSGHVKEHVISKLNDTKKGFGFRIWYTDKPREYESSFFEMAAVKILQLSNLTESESATNTTETSETSETSKESEKETSESNSAESQESENILSAVCPAQCVQGLPEDGVTVFQMNLLGLSKMRVRLIRDNKEVDLLADEDRLNLNSMADIKTKTVLKEPVKIKNGDILITTCEFEEDELDSPEIDSLDVCMATLQYYPRVPSFLFCAAMPLRNLTASKPSNMTLVKTMKNTTEESETNTTSEQSAELHEDLPSWLFPQIAFCAKVNQTIPKDALLQPKKLLAHIQPVMIKSPPVFKAKEKESAKNESESESEKESSQGFFDQESEQEQWGDQEEEMMGLELDSDNEGLNEYDLDGLEFEDEEAGKTLALNSKCVRPAMPSKTVLSSGKKAVGLAENDTSHMHFHSYPNSEKLDDEGKLRLLWRCEGEHEKKSMVQDETTGELREVKKKACSTLAFALEAETKGWVAIGFKEKGTKSDKKKDALKKSDFAVAWITNDKDLHFIDMNTLKSESPTVDESQDFYDIRGIESDDVEKFTTHATPAAVKETAKEKAKNATKPSEPTATGTGTGTGAQQPSNPQATGATGPAKKSTAARTQASFSVLLSFALGWLAVVLLM